MFSSRLVSYKYHKTANLVEFGKINVKAFDSNLGPAAPLVPGNVELRFLLIVTLQVFVHWIWISTYRPYPTRPVTRTTNIILW